MAYRLELDPDVCISSGRCVADAPGSIRFDADEIAGLVPDGEPIADEQMVVLARNCPSGALLVFDGQQPVRVF
ncbi:MAG TPA: (4Fe-4S)-binding protein [Trebonia sp.]|jgi:ferredoxin|nr:(4Fe-4S)-binding protein [Trebonia sp.]